MQLTWYGHAAFRVAGRTAAGSEVRIVLDPYNFPDCGGYLPLNVAADIVSISHVNPAYHSDTSSIRGDFEVLSGLDYAGSPRDCRGVRFLAHEVFENDQGEGPNAMVKFTLEGITVAHLGDLGHALRGEALGFLRDVDCLLALAGGAPTIALTDLRDLVLATRPALVVPMHYKTPKVNLNLLGLDDFLRAFDDFPVRRVASPATSLTADELVAQENGSGPTVLVLEHAR